MGWGGGGGVNFWETTRIFFKRGPAPERQGKKKKRKNHKKD